MANEGKYKFEDLRTDLDIEAYEKLKKEMEENAIAVISSKFQEVFERHPEVKAIVWTQYAPYFNDGDPCEFSVHELNFKLTEERKRVLGLSTEDEDDDWNYWESDISYKDMSPVAESQTALNHFAHRNMELFESAFGDSAQVACTREGFDVGYYEHD